MYTKCPSCRAEISFAAPANAAALPDGYKVRVRCPNCGVTISVKLPSRDAVASVQPTFTPAYPNAAPAEPVYTAAATTAPVDTPVDAKQAKKEARARKNANKKSGISRNVMILIISILLIACSVLGYYVPQITVSNKTVGDYLAGLDSFTVTITTDSSTETTESGETNSVIATVLGFNGIAQLKDIAAPATDDVKSGVERYGEIFDRSVAEGLLKVLPTIFFLGSILTAAVALICIFCKKYSRLFNLIMAFGLLAVSLCILFAPFISGVLTTTQMVQFFTGLVEGGYYLVFVPIGLGIIHALCSLIFLKSMKKKQVALD